MIIKFENLLIRYSKNLLISNYTHLGFKARLLHQNFRKAILGEYSGISIINPALTLSTLRYQARFLFNLALSNQKICFVAFEIPKYFRKELQLSSHYYLLNNWPSGIISNFKIVSRSHNLKKRSNYIPFLPAAIWVLGAEPSKTLAIVDEAKQKLLPTFTIVDSTINLSFLSYWVPSNTKSAYSKRFFLSYIKKLLYKAFLVRKRFFYKKVLKSMKSKMKRRAVTTSNNWKIRKINRARVNYYLKTGGKFNLLSDYNKFIVTGWNHLHKSVYSRRKNEKK